MYLECKAKRIFGIACLEKKVSFAYGFFEKKNQKYRVKNGWDAFRASRFFGALPPPLPFFSRPCFRLSLVSRVLSLSSRVLSLVSRSLARLSRCLAFSRSSLALSRSSLASVLWFESMMCVYDV